MASDTLVGKALERVLQVEGETKRGLAKRMGFSEQQIHSYFKNDIYMSSLIKIMDAMDYEIVFRPRTGMGTVTVQEEDPCAKCVIREQAVLIADACEVIQAEMVKDRARDFYEETGGEVDFYQGSKKK